MIEGEYKMTDRDVAQNPENYEEMNLMEEISGNVDSRFPGLSRIVEGNIDDVYIYFHEMVSENDFTNIPPALMEALEFDDPDPDVVMGPSSRYYQAIADLYQFMADEERSIEEAELAELNENGDEVDEE
jgi:hypothetical protein